MPEETAVREVAEESGVTATIVTALGDDSFVVEGRQIVVRYYLMDFKGSGPSSEHREIRWCDLAEALDLLGFDAPRHLVADAFARRSRSDEK